MTLHEEIAVLADKVVYAMSDEVEREYTDEIIAKVLADYPPYNKGFEEGYNTGFNDGCKSERAITIERVLAAVSKLALRSTDNNYHDMGFQNGINAAIKAIKGVNDD